MEININSLVSIKKTFNNFDGVLKIVDDIGKVIILNNNKRAYVISKYEESAEINTNKVSASGTYKLQEAMKIVLIEVQNNRINATELADIIYKRKLYVQKILEKAKCI